MKEKKLIVYKLNKLNVEDRLREMGYKDLYIRKHAIKYHYLITVILNKYLHYGRSFNKGYVKIYGELLRDEIGAGNGIDGKNTKLIYTIRQHLKTWGVIDWYNYQKNENDSEQKKQINGNGKLRDNVYKSKTDNSISTCDAEVHYRIEGDWYRNGVTKMADCDELRKLQSKVNKVNAKIKYEIKAEKREQLQKGVYKKLKKTFLKIELDVESAKKRLEEAKIKREKLSWERSGRKVFQKVMTTELATYYQMYIDRFNDDKFFHVDYKTGRIYSSLTNLPRLLRPFLRINGEAFAELDISNSQPLILCLLYRKWCEQNEIEIQKDGLEYQVLCETGQFYYNFKNYVSQNNVAVYETFKTDVFTRIFFNNDYGHLTSYQKLFKKRFPSVFQCISDIKKTHYKQVAKKLQTVEADIVINKIASRLFKEGITSFYTIHDCIAVTTEHREKVIEIMYEEFRSESLVPRIKMG